MTNLTVYLFLPDTDHRKNELFALMDSWSG